MFFTKMENRGFIPSLLSGLNHGPGEICCMLFLFVHLFIGMIVVFDFHFVAVIVLIYFEV